MKDVDKFFVGREDIGDPYMEIRRDQQRQEARERLKRQKKLRKAEIMSFKNFLVMGIVAVSAIVVTAGSITIANLWDSHQNPPPNIRTIAITEGEKELLASLKEAHSLLDKTELYCSPSPELSKALKKATGHGLDRQTCTHYMAEVAGHGFKKQEPIKVAQAQPKEKSPPTPKDEYSYKADSFH